MGQLGIARWCFMAYLDAYIIVAYYPQLHSMQQTECDSRLSKFDRSFPMRDIQPFGNSAPELLCTTSLQLRTHFKRRQCSISAHQTPGNRPFFSYPSSLDAHHLQVLLESQALRLQHLDTLQEQLITIPLSRTLDGVDKVVSYATKLDFVLQLVVS